MLKLIFNQFCINRAIVIFSRYANDGYGDDLDDIDQVDFISRYQFEQFGVGHVGEPKPQENLHETFGNSKNGFNPQSSPYKYVQSTRDLTLPLKQHRNTKLEYKSPEQSPEEDELYRKYLCVSVGMVSLITENLLSHPFVVLRRQCQVHHSSYRRHLVPITLIPVIVHLHQRQGVTTLWKGLGSCLLVRGMSLAVEDFISKITPWPK